MLICSICEEKCVWTFLKYPLDAVLQIWDDITSGRAEEDSSLLSRFFMISFADLKKWTFTYRFAFPGLVMSPQATAAACQPASDVFNSDEVTYLHGPFFLMYMSILQGHFLHNSCEYYVVGTSQVQSGDPCNLKTSNMNCYILEGLELQITSFGQYLWPKLWPGDDSKTFINIYFVRLQGSWQHAQCGEVCHQEQLSYNFQR